jgi:hypothetical protein
MMTLSSRPMDCGRGRRCGIWVSPLIRDGAILDTRALEDDELRLAGRDAFPEDCLLVVVSPKAYRRLLDDAAALPYPVGGPAVAATIIDAACRKDPTLASRIGWKL